MRFLAFEYIDFRNMAIPSISMADVGITVKLAIFHRILDFTDPKLKRVFAKRQWDSSVYYQMVTTLEVRFGGEDNLIFLHMMEVEKLPSVRMRDFFSLHDFTVTIGGYIDVLDAASQGNSAHTQDFYHKVYQKLPVPYRDEYQMWFLKQYGNIKNTALSVLEWAEQKLIMLRKNDIQTQVAQHIHDQKRGLGAVPKVNQGFNPTGNRFQRRQNTYPNNPGRVDNALLAQEDVGAEDEEEEAILLAALSDIKGCVCCHKDHRLEVCPVFQSMDVQPRIRFCLQAKVCIRCLNPGHFKRDCNQEYSHCERCTEKHHTLLHGAYLRRRGQRTQVQAFLTADGDEAASVEPSPETEEENRPMSQQK